MNKKLIIILSIVSVLVVAGWLVVRANYSQMANPTTQNVDSAHNPSSVAPGGSRAVSQAELSKNNGKDGASCWVAVDGTVYDVSNESTWKNGSHMGGQAVCGVDGSDAIGKSPHGTNALSGLPVVGTLH